MRCFQCQIGNHDNCLWSMVTDWLERGECLCHECTDADKAAAKKRDDERRKAYFEKRKNK